MTRGWLRTSHGSGPLPIIGRDRHGPVRDREHGAGIDRGGGPPDIVLVGINPLSRPDIPQTVQDINTRVNEIGFNFPLRREMRAMRFVNAVVEDGTVCGGRLKRVFVHATAADEVMERPGARSTPNASRVFLAYLRDAGRRHAGEWLERCHAGPGVRSTVDASAAYL